MWTKEKKPPPESSKTRNLLDHEIARNAKQEQKAVWPNDRPLFLTFCNMLTAMHVRAILYQMVSDLSVSFRDGCQASSRCYFGTKVITCMPSKQSMKYMRKAERCVEFMIILNDPY
jgi:hypothetical protein